MLQMQLRYIIMIFIKDMRAWYVYLQMSRAQHTDEKKNWNHNVWSVKHVSTTQEFDLITSVLKIDNYRLYRKFN